MITPQTWQQPSAEKDCYLNTKPYQFHDRRRTRRSARATVRFVEMLCQIDSRFDDLLPPCWIAHAYIFALLDALRCNYVYSYFPVIINGAPAPQPDSRAQTIFWQDEQSTYLLVQQFCTSKGLSAKDPCTEHNDDPGKLTKYSRYTENRRVHSDAAGLSVEAYYPWQDSAVAQADTAPVAATNYNPPSDEASTWDIVNEETSGSDSDVEFTSPFAS